MKAFLYFLPRVLSIAIVAFFLLMSFDTPILSVGFLMHNIPTVLVLIPIVLLWKNNSWSGAVFLILGVATVFFFNTYRDLIVFFTVSLPFFLISLLHFVNHFIKNERHR